MSNYLKHKGLALNSLGYSIVPIKAGTKRPSIPNWPNVKADEYLINDWLNQYDSTNTGVGILAKACPAIDIDILDEAVAEKVVEFCIRRLGGQLVRYGKKPKALLPFRVVPGVTIRKQKSTIYEDSKGDVHAVEVLGDGQLWVAFHTHPDTGEPYSWVDTNYPDSDLTDYTWDELPVLEQWMIYELMDFVEEQAIEAGWKVKSTGTTFNATALPNQNEDDLLYLKPPIGLSDIQISNLLKELPTEEFSDYDRWLSVGMAIHHETDGSEHGLDIFDEWSAAIPNYDADSVRDKWFSFHLNGYSNSYTMASIIKMVNEIKKRESFFNGEQILNELLQQLENMTTKQGVLLEFPALVCSYTKLDDSLLRLLIKAYQDRHKLVLKVSLPAKEARKRLQNGFSCIETDYGKKYPWANDYVYLKDNNLFWHKTNYIGVTPQAFNAEFDRHVLSIYDGDIIEDKARPVVHAAEIALNLVKIATVTGCRYSPGAGEMFELEGLSYINNYRPNKIKPKPEGDFTKEDHDLIERLEMALTRVSGDPIEQRIFRQWLSYKLQNLDKKMQWSMFMQGPPGSGKSLWAVVMKLLLGVHNCKFISPSALEGLFSNWASDHVLGIIEEIMLNGSKRYDILNKLKPYITNQTITVRPPYGSEYDAPNHADYMITSNEKNAIPVDDSDRRYFVLFSGFIDRSDVMKADAALDAICPSGNWWATTYSLLNERPETALTWLNDTDLSNFSPNKAPENPSKIKMIAMSVNPIHEAIYNLFDDESRPEITADLFAATDVFEALRASGDVPHNMTPKAFSNIVMNMGFEHAGIPRRSNTTGRMMTAIKLHKKDPKNYQLWSNHPDRGKWTIAEVRSLYFEQKDKGDFDDFLL
ncbi:PriCT-2 domain-containing protein [Thalassotalea fonticola]|uniref:PriCT-2 domain-containing protein n=1 Tax=Thalassotalea fonticola TaxID=3065649 RepID=A0ABZ0GPF3_9GAMM|nr:PriCT-2 domain-containing protein [Colwelliaceae bacterium S1-1]